MASRKQIEEARASVGYVPKAMTCGQCAHMRSDRVPVAWMVKENTNRQAFNLPPLYDLSSPASQSEVNVRCEQPGVVPFSVKRAGQCRNWLPKGEGQDTSIETKASP